MTAGIDTERRITSPSPTVQEDMTSTCPSRSLCSDAMAVPADRQITSTTSMTFDNRIYRLETFSAAYLSARCFEHVRRSPPVNHLRFDDVSREVYLLTPTDCATVPASRQSTVAPYTELSVECAQQSAIVVDCRPRLPRLLSQSGAVNNRPTAVAVYIAPADLRRAVAEFPVPEGSTLI